MTSRMFAILAVATISVSAYADKEARDEMARRTQPAIDKAQSAYKTACGCDLSIAVDQSTVTSEHDLGAVAFIADAIAEGAPKYCTDAPSKKAMCQLRQLTLGKSPKASFTFSGGKGVATVDTAAHCTWLMITRELDK